MPAQVLVSANRKNFKKAVQRNRIKRIIREAYRYNKSGLYEFLTNHEKQCALAIVYTGTSMPDFKQTLKKINAALNRLTEEQKMLLDK